MDSESQSRALVLPSSREMQTVREGSRALESYADYLKGHGFNTENLRGKEFKRIGKIFEGFEVLMYATGPGVKSLTDGLKTELRSLQQPDRLGELLTRTANVALIAGLAIYCYEATAITATSLGEIPQKITEMLFSYVDLTKLDFTKVKLPQFDKNFLIAGGQMISFVQQLLGHPSETLTAMFEPVLRGYVGNIDQAKQFLADKVDYTLHMAKLAAVSGVGTLAETGIAVYFRNLSRQSTIVLPKIAAIQKAWGQSRGVYTPPVNNPEA